MLVRGQFVTCVFALHAPVRSLDPSSSTSSSAPQSVDSGLHHRHIFLWAVKTLHGANLNNQYRKKKDYPVSQSK